MAVFRLIGISLASKNCRFSRIKQVEVVCSWLRLKSARINDKRAVKVT